ncbi:phosphoglucose isomerase (PGI) [Methanocaldococcus infernus ME]|uniref:glucose-6-phosphate isomerase n=1 Tax=Methanocaldococcus infernus (strain DSM 11812 / JCM 15783 / ME) TaxID=573063 RepID=D5VQP6_METIM|nr:glucose-6-phosphate isomerase [Methanocaldococcus infernus]ADG12899.1 phosphoglucose isomerase (PGI) [Methanocaldococcus infernus ME]
MKVDFKNCMIDINKDYSEELNKFLTLFSPIRETIYKEEVEEEFHDEILVIGMGGSILGTETIYYALNPECKAIFLDNTDPESTLRKIKSLENPKVYVVSKSGNTLETLINYKLVKEKVKVKEFIFITNGGKLLEIAKKNNYRVLNIPEEVPGRYSIFTAVGKAPLSAVGVDVKRLLKGAKALDQIDEKHEAIKNAIIHYLHEREGRDISVLFTYVEALTYFGEWYKQLVGESLGKNGLGITPLLSIGAKDQHSLLQLYLDGKKDKVITFLTVDNYREDVEIEFENAKKYSEIIKAEKLATEKALTNRGVPNITVELKEVCEEELGSLLYFYMIQVAFMGVLYNINPFNQPAVEEEKRICWSILRK